jgi:CDP-paratose 2-epimerase
MKLLVTGACGLIGSAVVNRFCSAGHAVVGVDNDSRAEYFGPDGSTASTKRWLEERHGLNYRHYGFDVRDAAAVFDLFDECDPFDAVVHCAAQPSHDWAAARPLEDFDVNARGTLNLLEATSRHCPEAVFVFMSTNKVYGAELGGLFPVDVVERTTRFEFLDHGEVGGFGVHERFPVDQTMHAPYGVSKLAADLAVQEYGRYYGMRTVCLRAGCITGAGHAAVPLHGFLSYLVKCNVRGERYVVKGYGGKQVRDNLHAADLARLIGMMIYRPSAPGSVYNVGGGKANSCSILEAFAAVEELTGENMECEFDPEPRRGDHQVYYTDLRKVIRDYPEWQVERDLPSIYAELVEDWQSSERAKGEG